MNGLDLKLERIARQVKAQDVAREMGVTASRITQLERPESHPTPPTIARYRAALDTCAPSSTSRAA